MYTDDTVIYVADKRKENIEQLPGEDLEIIAVYFKTNELIINLKKGVYVSIRVSKNLKNKIER